jgi:hypothetical protein
LLTGCHSGVSDESGLGLQWIEKSRQFRVC